MADALIVYQGAIGQPVTDQIKVGNKPIDLTGATVTFKMRNAFSNTLKVNSAASITDAATGKVSYSWTSLDVDTQGEYKAWWSLNLSGSVIDTEEFDVIVAEHAPGLRTETGAIYRASMSILPSTWIALQDSETYGDSVLQEKIEYVKLKVLGTTVAVADESSLDLRVVQYIAKNVAVQIIPAGVDYWLNQKVSVEVDGTGTTLERYDYEDRASRLMELLDKLLADIADETDDIEEILGVYNTRSTTSTAAYQDGTDEGFVTPSPVNNFRDYAFTQYPPNRNNGKAGY